MTTLQVNDDLHQLISESYHKVEKMLWLMVHKYHRRFGGDLEELISQAKESFMEAIHSWDPDRGAFTTHVYTRVYYGLRSYARALYKQGGFAKDKPTVDPITVVAKTSFDWHSFAKELSDEAREVAQVALDLSALGQPAKPEAIASLLTEAGWAAAEILKCFRELREALTS